MLNKQHHHTIQSGEGLKTEFKLCQKNLSKSLFESICAFLNRIGGQIFLGVADNGSIIGLEATTIKKIKRDFSTAINNPQKLSPSFYLSLEEIEIEEKTILYLCVPESSQVHRCNNRIYDRNEDGDFDITDQQYSVTSLYIRKQSNYTENTIYPYASLADLREDLLTKVRKIVSLQRKGHPWQNLDDHELLESARLMGIDYQTGKSGITLAGILLFGKDNTILSVLPHHKTDAILRKKKIDRYDDRDDIRTNLIESYDRLLHFGQKHLPDPFYLEKDKRMSVRDIILREVIGNLLIHREFTNPFPAKFIIDNQHFYTENSNKPHHFGIVNPVSFSPHPKNPIIAKVFREIGLADELGSGVRKLFQYSATFCGNNPQLEEGDIFRFQLSLTEQVTGQASGQVTGQATGQVTGQASNSSVATILQYCRQARKASEIQALLGLKHRETFQDNHLKPILNQQLLSLTIPEKPRSPAQQYKITAEGKAWLEKTNHLGLLEE
ncbi:MAG: ATP-dependent DNA helicase RecG [marine bacterium B5-7]|nr:MAG: ATP-dependent DNA helicase RecG [marine bacterium B5-7]